MRTKYLTLKHNFYFLMLLEDSPTYSFTKEIITPNVRLRMLHNGIVHYTYLPNSEVSVKEHQLNHNALVEITEGIKAHLLIDSDEFINITQKHEN